MKNNIQFVGGFLLITILLLSCSSKNRWNYLPPLKIEVSKNLANNSEIVAFISDNTEALNNWSIRFEDLVVDCTPFVVKAESELTDEEKKVYGKLMLEFVASMGQFAVYVAEMQQSATTVSYALNDEQLEAMKVINTEFENRIVEINSRYKDFGKEE